MFPFLVMFIVLYLLFPAALCLGLLLALGAVVVDGAVLSSAAYSAHGCGAFF